MKNEHASDNEQDERTEVEREYDEFRHAEEPTLVGRFLSWWHFSGWPW